VAAITESVELMGDDDASFARALDALVQGLIERPGVHSGN